jgi:pyruvate dehydrogenase E2 component (dihydrolipoamide acetyltransferase)
MADPGRRRGPALGRVGPESGILAVGALIERLVFRDGVVVAQPTLALSLSAGHRVEAGVAAARFLAELKRRLEAPDPR